MRKRTKQARGGIERKFIRSIVWVGVVPMTLALIIGYLFARESQMITTLQNQATTARKTAEGVWLALQGRLLMTERVALAGEVVEGLRRYCEDRGDFDEAMLHRLQTEASRTGSMQSVFSVYDADGQFLVSTRTGGEDRRAHPEWVYMITKTRFFGPRFIEDEQRYAVNVVAPIRDPSSGELLGYLSEEQGIQDLLDFALGHAPSPSDSYADENSYQVVYVGLQEQFAAYHEELAGADRPALRTEAVDEGLAERLRRFPDMEHDSFFLWHFKSRGQTRAVLMAYHRLYPGMPLYFIVYRPGPAVLANINLGAVLTVVVSGLAIGIFCIIGYRIVNNNIIRPVSLLNEGAQIIRQGDLELKLKIETGDEIEELASSFNKMAAALRQNIKQLEESEEKYRSLITSMRDGIYQTDAEGVLTFLNPAGAKIFGLARAEDALGVNVRGLFTEEMDFARLVRELTKNRFVEHTRAWVQAGPSPALCLDISANSIFDERHEFMGVEGSFRDVTQNVRLEQQARERSERISAINHLTNVVNSSLEAGRVYENIVIELRKLVHLDSASLDLLRDEDHLSEFAPDGAAFKTRQLWPEAVSRQDVADAGTTLSEQWTVSQDNSCAAWVARERRCLIIDDLSTAGSAFASKFPPDTKSCVSVPLHAAGRIVGALNLGARRTAAFSQHEVEVLQQLTPHLAVAIRNAQLLENLQQSLEEVTKAREKLHEANEELKTLDEMKTNLLSNVSHELRTPLVAVMGYTDMILNGKVGPINEVQKEYLGISLRNIEKLVTLIENLLDFSRLHRGAEEVVFDTLDLVDCARTSMQIVKPVADSRNIALALHVRQPESVRPPEAEGTAEAADVVLVEGDKGKLGQVFNNLLSNAVKFNENGGSVTIEIQVSDSNVEVSVTDTGIGIPEEALDKVFTRFYQYDGSSTRKYGGTGIGLAIAQDIVRLHGSLITVSSTVGKGSTFRFSLPLSGGRHRGREAAEAAGSRGLPIPTETHLLVELVTQDRALSAQIRNLLLSEGMDVIHAAYPAVAVSLASRYNPDCILVDTDAGPLASVVMDEILNGPGLEDVPICLLTNDDALYERYQKRVAGRIRRGFRKSSLLSGINFAMSRGVAMGEQLGTKILCVDDDVEIVRFMARCLESEGYETEQCLTGEEALIKVESGEYWLVLLDLAMPGLDGWETCRRMKSNAALAGLKVYIVTAKPIDKSLDKVHEAGADGYLLKPFKAEDLVELAKNLNHR